jgi:CheY-like chemotaxis protein
MLEQVMLNLVVNARDAMEGQGVRRLGIEVDGGFEALPPGGRAAGPFVTVRVSDTGAGIPAEVLPHIFEPFFTTKEVGRGTGLGLSMVHGIAEQHGGWVSVESRPGEGSSFTVHLPRILEATRSAALRPAGAVGGGTETLLIVEDEPQVRRVAVRTLSKLGYRMLEASTAAEALALLESHRHEVALVLTDIVMPGPMTGFQLAARIEEVRPTVKVIFASGYAAGSARGDVVLVEGINFIAKPYSPALLARIIRDRLDQPPVR